MLRWLLSKREPVNRSPREERAPVFVEPFDKKSLARLSSVKNYRTAEPFPHLVIDGLFSPQALDLVLSEWPPAEASDVRNFHDGTYTKLKYGSSYHTRLGPHTHFFLTSLREPPFLEALEKVTGIQGLIPDPYMQGGGLHFTRTGGKLAVHADFIKHPKLNLDRRLNLIVYLNREWTESNRGWLELWDREMRRCVERVLPVFNRTVVFSTSDYSFHGQPEPVQGPPDLFRRSIALYYYTNGRPPGEYTGRDPAATLWQKRPGSGY